MRLQDLSLLVLNGLIFIISVGAAPQDSHHTSQNPRQDSVNEDSIKEYPAESNMEVDLPGNIVKRGESSWSLSLYTGNNCDDDYYFLEGNNVADPTKCMDLIGGIGSEYTDNGVFCRYFTDGGFDSVSCENSIAVPIQSWILKGGVCLTYENNCTAPGQASMMVPLTGCQKAADRSAAYMSIQSLRCFAH